MGTPNISLISLPPFRPPYFAQCCRISEMRHLYFTSIYYFYFFQLLQKRCARVGGWGGGVASCCYSLYLYPWLLFHSFSIFLSFFFFHSFQPAPRVRERYGFSAGPKFTLTLLYTQLYVSLPFEYYSNRNSLLAKVA
jgi:hypothetical protein